MFTRSSEDRSGIAACLIGTKCLKVRKGSWMLQAREVGAMSHTIPFKAGRKKNNIFKHKNKFLTTISFLPTHTIYINLFLAAPLIICYFFFLPRFIHSRS